MAAIDVHSRFSDVMSEFDSAMNYDLSASMSAMSQSSANPSINPSVNLSSMSQTSINASTSISTVNMSDNISNNISNNMFLGYGPPSLSLNHLVSLGDPPPAKRKSSTIISSLAASRSQSKKDVRSDAEGEGHEGRKVEGRQSEVRSSTKLAVSKDSSSMDVKIRRDQPELEMSPRPVKPNPYTNWVPESGTERSYIDLSSMASQPSILRTMRDNLHTMTGRMESDKYRESAMRLEMRMSEMLSDDRPWATGDYYKQTVKRVGSDVDPVYTSSSRLAENPEPSRPPSSLITSNLSAMSDVTLLSRKLSQSGSATPAGNFVESQINVMNSVLDAVKEKGTSVDPSNTSLPLLSGEPSDSVAGIYDSLNIEKLRLQTIENLLSQAHVKPMIMPAYRVPYRLSQEEIKLNSRNSFSSSSHLDSGYPFSGITLADRLQSLVLEGDSSMNSHVAASTSFHDDSWGANDTYHTAAHPSSRKTPKRKGTSKSISDLAESKGVYVAEVRKQNPTRSNTTAPFRGQKTKSSIQVSARGKTHQGDGKTLNKSQNRNRESVARLRPEVKHPRITTLDYPGENFQPHSTFGQWSFSNTEKQNEPFSGFDHKEQPKNFRKSNFTLPHVTDQENSNSYNSNSYNSPVRVASPAANNTVNNNVTDHAQAKDTELKPIRKVEINKTRSNRCPYEPQITVRENGIVVASKSSTQECLESAPPLSMKKTPGGAKEPSSSKSFHGANSSKLIFKFLQRAAGYNDNKNMGCQSQKKIKKVVKKRVTRKHNEVPEVPSSSEGGMDSQTDSQID